MPYLYEVYLIQNRKIQFTGKPCVVERYNKTRFVALDKMVTSLENSFTVSLTWPVLSVQESM